MPPTDGFKEREKGLEGSYFHAVDAKLLENLRSRASLDVVARALKEKLDVEDPALLKRISELGVTPDTGAAFLLAPLVQVAWADGSVTEAEREAVFEMAADRGIDPASPAHALLVTWLDARPPTGLFDTSIAAIRAGLSVLPAKDRDERVRQFAEACRRVARASGAFAGLLKMQGSISSEEEELLDVIASQMQGSVAS